MLSSGEMGQLQLSYQLLAPMVMAAGCRVAQTAPRSLRNSAIGSDTNGDDATAVGASRGCAASYYRRELTGYKFGGSAREWERDIVTGFVPADPVCLRPRRPRVQAHAIQGSSWLRLGRPSWHLDLPMHDAGRRPVAFLPVPCPARGSAPQSMGTPRRLFMATRTGHPAAVVVMGLVWQLTW